MLIVYIYYDDLNNIGILLNCNPLTLLLETSSNILWNYFATCETMLKCCTKGDSTCVPYLSSILLGWVLEGLNCIGIFYVWSRCDD